MIPVSIRLDSHLSFSTAGLPEPLLDYFRQLATFPNPEYRKAKRYSRWVPKDIPPYLYFYEEADGRLILPRGLLGKVNAAFVAQGFKPTWEDHRLLVPVEYPAMHKSYKLRPYQEEAVSAFERYRMGVIVSPAGSGKTVKGLASVARSGQRALWIVHTKELAEQAIERFEQFLGIQAGYIGDGEFSYGEQVTVGIINSLLNQDLDSLTSRFGMIVVDEAHRVPSASFRDLVSRFPARYRLGLTATPERADGLHPLLYAAMGPVLFRTTYAELEKKGYVMLPKLNVVFTDFDYPYQESSDYAPMSKMLTLSPERNRLVVTHVLNEAKKGRFCLVLTPRKDHCELLAKMIAAHGVKVEWVTSQVNKERRRDIRMRSLNKEIDVLVATQLADEGLDLPGIEALFLAFGERSAARTEQRVGRCVRPQEGKEQPVVYDFVDYKVGVLLNQFRHRLDVYERMGIYVSPQIKAYAQAM